MKRSYGLTRVGALTMGAACALGGGSGCAFLLDTETLAGVDGGGGCRDAACASDARADAAADDVRVVPGDGEAGAAVAIAWVQTNAVEYPIDGGAGASTLTVSLTGAVADHDAILVAMSYAGTTGATTLPVVTDTASNAYAALASPAPGLYVFGAFDTRPGPCTITVAFGQPLASAWVAAVEYAGLDLDAATAVDALTTAAGASDAGTNTVSSGDVTTTSASELLFGFVASNNVLDAGTGFVERRNDNRSGTLIEDRIVDRTGSYAATASPVFTSSWQATLLTLRGQTR